MDVETDAEYTRKMIDGLIKIQDDILKIPNLSIKQKDDIDRLGEELDFLSLQTDDMKIKLALVDMMNRMN
ncbi:MAG: hypothetical protein E6K97_02950 [Thaumarchaeota archaeon]|nr:MAG: hypothetical protein E6K97_02950 [Nitrososphaerota archaeon]